MLKRPGKGSQGPLKNLKKALKKFQIGLEKAPRKLREPLRNVPKRFLKAPKKPSIKQKKGLNNALKRALSRP